MYFNVLYYLSCLKFKILIVDYRKESTMVATVLREIIQSIIMCRLLFVPDCVVRLTKLMRTDEKKVDTICSLFEKSEHHSLVERLFMVNISLTTSEFVTIVGRDM